MTDPLAPLIIKWLMHDLASPIATVMTASELLSDTPDAEINGLVQDGAKRLGARLRLVRAALAPGDAPIGGTALERLVREGTDGTPLTWDRATADTDGRQSAVVAGAVMLLADVRRSQPLIVTADGAHWSTPQQWPDAIAAALAGAPPTDGRSALAALLAAAAARAGMQLTVVDDGLLWS